MLSLHYYDALIASMNATRIITRFYTTMPPNTEPTWIVEIAKAGPWATVAGLLLWTVIKAWNKDREQVTGLLGEFRGSMDKLTHQIEMLIKEVANK